MGRAILIAAIDDRVPRRQVLVTPAFDPGRGQLRKRGITVQQYSPPPPQGALRQPDGSVVWRVWAPLSPTVSLVTLSSGQRHETAMTPEGGGYFSHWKPQAEEGLRYAFQLADGGEYPDPASRWQPDGVHRFSALFFPESYCWSDPDWRGVARDDLVIYELHVGTFTPEGRSRRSFRACRSWSRWA